jgi:LysM repeat protein
MTVAEPRPSASPPSAPAEPVDRVPQTQQCPFLTSADGTWRAASATREHRCAAVTPPAPLTAEKQRRLCLTPGHVSCATYVAAEAASGSRPGRAAGLPRPVARTTPVILDHHRFGAALRPFVSDRTTGQTVLVAVLLVAFLAIVIAQLSGAGGSSPGGILDPSASPGATASAKVTPTASARASASAGTTPSATPAASPTQPSEAPSAAPAATPSAGSSTAVKVRTYTVRSGDTLTQIATRFGTTTKVLITLNGLSSPSSLRVGQVLKLP